MAGAYNAQNVKIAPHDAYYEAAEAVCVDFKGILATDLDAKYFNIYDSLGTQYYVWFDLDSGSVDPAPGGTGIEIDISTGDSATAMATALAAGVFTGYTASADGTIVFLVATDNEEVATDAADGDSGLAVSVISKGGNIYLGLLDGDISITPNTSVFDVTAHQTGTTILSQLFQGFDATVEFTLLECTKTLYNEMIFLAGGGKVTPGGGTEFAGFGTGSIGTSALLKARTLRLHPVSKDAADLTCDWYFWKAKPELGAITISGENPQTLPLTFTAYPDTTKQEIIDVFGLGDGSQSGLNK